MNCLLASTLVAAALGIGANAMAASPAPAGMSYPVCDRTHTDFLPAAGPERAIGPAAQPVLPELRESEGQGAEGGLHQ